MSLSNLNRLPKNVIHDEYQGITYDATPIALFMSHYDNIDELINSLRLSIGSFTLNAYHANFEGDERDETSLAINNFIGLLNAFKEMKALNEKKKVQNKKLINSH